MVLSNGGQHAHPASCVLLPLYYCSPLLVVFVNLSRYTQLYPFLRKAASCSYALKICINSVSMPHINCYVFICSQHIRNWNVCIHFNNEKYDCGSFLSGSRVLFITGGGFDERHFWVFMHTALSTKQIHRSQNACFFNLLTKQILALKIGTVAYKHTHFYQQSSYFMDRRFSIHCLLLFIHECEACAFSCQVRDILFGSSLSSLQTARL